MAERLAAVLDHIAVAVPDRDAAQQRWRDELGGRLVAWEDNPAFASLQLRFNGGAKLELVAPPADAAPDHFLRAFLERFGARAQHVTLKVDDLGAAVEVVREAGLDVVDVRQDDPEWREAFLRPSQVGGLVVQLAWSARTDAEWAERLGHSPEPPPADGAVLVALILRHPDLQAAAALWHLLGAAVESGPDGLVCSWPGSPAGLVIRHGAVAASEALLFAGTAPLPAAPGIGPAVEVVPGS